ncbi:MAG: glycosyltransferase family 39 protein, partial [Candidatus Binatia bacterium]
MSGGETPTRTQAAFAAAVLAAAVGLKIACAFRMGFDSDEPQHLHVAWAWTRGLVQYRDVFDNHTPLFHLSTAPLVWAIGERADLLVWMRLAMIPLWALSVWSVYRIGGSLFSLPHAVTAAVLAGLFPWSFLTSVEFRADDLWAALWLLTLALVFAEPRGRRRALAAGLVLGATFAASMKTAVLVGTFSFGFALVFLLDRGAREWLRRRGPWNTIVWMAAGATVVPATLAVLFAWLGALGELYQCVVVHNVSAAGLLHHRMPRAFLFAVTLLVLLAIARGLLRHAPRPSLGRRRAAFFLGAAFSLAVVTAFSPLQPPQHFLPLYPPLVLLGVGIALESARSPAASVGLAAAAAAIEIAVILSAAPPWNNRTKFGVAVVADVLRLTRPHERIMDFKGEGLFRRRATYHVLEDVTRERMRRAEIRDDIAERLIATRTYVTLHDTPRFPPRTRQFLLDNYVPLAHLRVAGRFLTRREG